jgi:small subunit ribosomal protein S4
MARYTGPVCRLCRRHGEKLFLKGERCQTEKCAQTRRPYPPGQHGQGRIKLSEYALRLREKQKVRRIYGVAERQFRLYFDRASRMRGGTGEQMLGLLERRLDSAVYRMGYGATRREARQLVKHNHVLVNGRRINIPSYILRVGDKVEIREKKVGPHPRGAQRAVHQRAVHRRVLLQVVSSRASRRTGRRDGTLHAGRRRGAMDERVRHRGRDLRAVPR